MTQLEVMFLQTMIDTMQELVEIQKETQEVLVNLNKTIYELKNVIAEKN